jgi:hypothetical protein
MMKTTLLAFSISALVSLAVFAGEKQSKQSKEIAEEKKPEEVIASNLGKKVTFSGEAESRHLGAVLRGKGFSIWIDGLHDWPDDLRGKRVSVTGTVIERHDLPVFIQNRANRGVQGIPVPKGTNLHEAAHRYLLKDATWKLE